MTHFDSFMIIQQEQEVRNLLRTERTLGRALKNVPVHCQNRLNMLKSKISMQCR